MHVLMCMLSRFRVLFFVSAQAESRKRLELLQQEEGKSLGMEAAIAAEVKKRHRRGYWCSGRCSINSRSTVTPGYPSVNTLRTCGTITFLPRSLAVVRSTAKCVFVSHSKWTASGTPGEKWHISGIVQVETW